MSEERSGWYAQKLARQAGTTVSEKDNSVQRTLRITIKRSNVEYNRVYQDTCYCSAIDKIYSSLR